MCDLLVNLTHARKICRSERAQARVERYISAWRTTPHAVSAIRDKTKSVVDGSTKLSCRQQNAATSEILEVPQDDAGECPAEAAAAPLRRCENQADQPTFPFWVAMPVPTMSPRESATNGWAALCRT